MDRLRAAIDTIVLAEDYKGGDAIRAKVAAQLSDFATTVRPAREWAVLDDTQLGEELRTLNLLNFNLAKASDEKTGFEELVRGYCLALLRAKYAPDHAALIAGFLVSRCDVDFLELCDDYVYDPEDFDDGVDYEQIFFRLASYADSILAAERAEGVRKVSDNQQLSAQERADKTAPIDKALEAWEATDAETILKLINDSSSELAQLMKVYRSDKGQHARSGQSKVREQHCEPLVHFSFRRPHQTLV